MYLHDLVKTSREAAGLSQDDLARLCNVTQQTVSRWETGESTPKPPHFLALSRALKVPLDEIIASMAETMDKPPKPRAAQDRLDELEERVAKLELRLRRLEKLGKGQ